MNEPARERPTDFFISYATAGEADRLLHLLRHRGPPYAERLYELLKARSNPFFDKRPLRVGEDWDELLLAALITVAIVGTVALWLP